jgi:caffeoyl-CoA O-methyltransferase
MNAGWPALLGILAAALLPALAGDGFAAGAEGDLDRKVQAFLDRHRDRWRDMNVPAADGKILYDLIVRNGYRRALEIGTSTGHSAIWIAWALSKTDGRLITIEIDEERFEEARKHIEEAGLSSYVDARRADAHELVPALEGPFDFVFCDADKGWYTNYLTAVLPKLDVGGCFAAHNVGEDTHDGGGTAEFYRTVKTLPYLETTLAPGSPAGMSISIKKAVK